MSDLAAIKEEVFNSGLVKPLLESMGCEINNRTSNTNRIEASRPNGNGNRSVQVYLNENLTSRVRSKAHVPIRDIYDLVSYIRFGKELENDIRNNIPKSKEYIIDTLKLNGFNSNSYTISQEDPNDWLKKIKTKREKRINLEEIEPNPVLPETTLKQFINLPHERWLNEGMDYNLLQEFEIGFDVMTERITIPIRDRNGKLISIKGRRTNPENSSKYLYLYPFNKAQEFFNLHRAIPFIREKNEVIIPEGEKSVIKLWGMNYKNSISQMGSEFSRIQVEILFRLNPNIKVIVIYDKDKMVEEIQQMLNPFKEKFSQVYATYDVDNLLEEKDSPVDRGKEVWDKIYKDYVYPINLK